MIRLSGVGVRGGWGEEVEEGGQMPFPGGGVLS